MTSGYTGQEIAQFWLRMKVARSHDRIACTTPSCILFSHHGFLQRKVRRRVLIAKWSLRDARSRNQLCCDFIYGESKFERSNTTVETLAATKTLRVPNLLYLEIGWIQVCHIFLLRKIEQLQWSDSGRASACTYDRIWSWERRHPGCGGVVALFRQPQCSGSIDRLQRNDARSKWWA